MSLKSKIEIDYQNSVKSKDKLKISTYRLILSAIKDMAKVMGELKKNYSDSLDFSKTGIILKEILNK